MQGCRAAARPVTPVPRPTRSLGYTVEAMSASQNQPDQALPPLATPPAAAFTGRRIAAACIVLAGFLLVSAVLALTLAPSNPAGRDFIEYWAAAQRLAHHASPYSWDGVLAVEKSAGFGLERPEFWYSPPSDLMLALPLGYVSARTGLLLWVTGLFAALCLALWLLWRLEGRPNSLLPLAALAFAPALACIQAGQISLLMLLGLTVFLSFHATRPFLAGAAMLPCTLKPHLFLPFALTLLLWALFGRRFRLLAGFAAAFLAGCAVTFSFDPYAWAEYAQMMRTEGMLHEFVPTLAESLRYAIHRDSVWIQFVPEVLACAWAAWYFWTRRTHWNWMEQGLVVLLVSAVCRPYGWFFDESVLLPALLVAALRARPAGRSLLPIGLAAAAALVLYLAGLPLAGHAYLWTTVAWLACFLYGTRQTARASQPAVEPAP